MTLQPKLYDSQAPARLSEFNRRSRKTKWPNEHFVQVIFVIEGAFQTMPTEEVRHANTSGEIRSESRFRRRLDEGHPPRVEFYGPSFEGSRVRPTHPLIGILVNPGSIETVPSNLGFSDQLRYASVHKSRGNFESGLWPGEPTARPFSG